MIQHDYVFQMCSLREAVSVLVSVSGLKARCVETLSKELEAIEKMRRCNMRM